MNSSSPESKKRFFNVGLWVLLHIALMVAVVIAYPWKVDKNLYSIVPESEMTPEIHAAENELTARTSSCMVIFVGDSDFSVAKTAAVRIGQTPP